MAAPSRDAVTKKLQIPTVSQDSQVELTIGGTKFEIKFGDMFASDATSTIWTPIIPNFRGGILLKLFLKHSGLGANTDYEHDYDGKYQLFDLNVAGMPSALLYKYDKHENRLCNEFEMLAKTANPGSTLVFPLIGVNNGMTIGMSALKLFQGITMCLENPDSVMHTMEKIVIITPFNADQESVNTRAIRHLFNLANIYNHTRECKECIVCMEVKADTILSCGHYCVCAQCAEDISHINNECPICKEQITSKTICYTPIDCSKEPCCGAHHAKLPMICMPCGHYNVACDACADEHGNACPKCGQYVAAFIPFFDS